MINKDIRETAEYLYDKYSDFDYLVHLITLNIDEADGINIEFWEDVLNRVYIIHTSTSEIRNRKVNKILNHE